MMMTFLVMVMMTTTIMMGAMVMARRTTCTRLRMVMMIVNFGDKNCCRTSGEGAAEG